MSQTTRASMVGFVRVAAALLLLLAILAGAKLRCGAADDGGAVVPGPGDDGTVEMLTPVVPRRRPGDGGPPASQAEGGPASVGRP